MQSEGPHVPVRCDDGRAGAIHERWYPFDMSAPYAPIRDHAVIGDGRTVALVTRDGVIDWLCLPNLDSPSVFAGLLDANRGGGFALTPDGPHDASRRYLPGTNVLETTFTTARGVVRVTDTMTLPGVTLGPARELVRRVEGLAGTVNMRWTVEPRFGYGLSATCVEPRTPFPVATSGSGAVAVCTWDAGSGYCNDRSMGGDFQVRDGQRALLVLAAAHQEPLVLPARADVEARLDATVRFWRPFQGDVLGRPRSCLPPRRRRAVARPPPVALAP